MSEQLFETGERPADAGACRRDGAPLAVRMRPRALDDLVGQEHLLGRGLDAADGDRGAASRTR